MAAFKIGDVVEILGYAHRQHQNEEELGWRRATIANIRGKFVSLEYDSQRHPEKLAEIVKVGETIRHEIVEDGPLSIDSMSRTEIEFTPDLVQWVTYILSNPEAEHERYTFFDQLSLLQKTS